MCEKMGDLTACNGGCLYDELSSFLSQLNLYRGKEVALSHELALFLHGHSWTQETGIIKVSYTTTTIYINYRLACYPLFSKT